MIAAATTAVKTWASPGAVADAVLKLFFEGGWILIAVVAGSALLWKLLDAWGKRK